MARGRQIRVVRYERQVVRRVRVDEPAADAAQPSATRLDVPQVPEKVDEAESREDPQEAMVSRLTRKLSLGRTPPALESQNSSCAAHVIPYVSVILIVWLLASA